MKSRGFTIIELLVVISIIGVIATTLFGSVSDIRLRAKDRAVIQAVYQFKTQAYFYYPGGDYSGLCNYRPGLQIIADFIIEQGGAIEECSAGSDDFVFIVGLPSEQVAHENALVKTAYAQSAQDAYCTNSFGNSMHINLNNRQSDTNKIYSAIASAQKKQPLDTNNNRFNPFCSIEEAEEILEIEISDSYAAYQGDLKAESYGYKCYGETYACFAYDTNDKNIGIIDNNYCKNAGASIPAC